DDPELSKVLDAFALFDTFSSPWFSAIYILLFISLIGCVLPRIVHHARALAAPPPRTPANLARLDGRVLRPWSGSAASALDAAERALRRRRYRVIRFEESVSAERGM